VGWGILFGLRDEFSLRRFVIVYSFLFPSGIDFFPFARGRPLSIYILFSYLPLNRDKARSISPFVLHPFPLLVVFSECPYQPYVFSICLSQVLVCWALLPTRVSPRCAQFFNWPVRKDIFSLICQSVVWDSDCRRVFRVSPPISKQFVIFSLFFIFLSYCWRRVESLFSSFFCCGELPQKVTSETFQEDTTRNLVPSNFFFFGISTRPHSPSLH